MPPPVLLQSILQRRFRYLQSILQHLYCYCWWRNIIYYFILHARTPLASTDHTKRLWRAALSIRIQSIDWFWLCFGCCVLRYYGNPIDLRQRSCCEAAYGRYDSDVRCLKNRRFGVAVKKLDATIKFIYRSGYSALITLFYNIIPQWTVLANVVVICNI